MFVRRFSAIFGFGACFACFLSACFLGNNQAWDGVIGFVVVGVLVGGKVRRRFRGLFWPFWPCKGPECL
jgi:hypothetical protein